MKVYCIFLIMLVSIFIHLGRSNPCKLQPNKLIKQIVLNKISLTTPVSDNWRSKSSKSRVTGPVFTIIKTDKNSNFKWGVRHYVGKKYQ